MAAALPHALLDFAALAGAALEEPHSPPALKTSMSAAGAATARFIWPQLPPLAKASAGSCVVTLAFSRSETEETAGFDAVSDAVLLSPSLRDACASPASTLAADFCRFVSFVSTSSTLSAELDSFCLLRSFDCAEAENTSCTFALASSLIPGSNTFNGRLKGASSLCCTE